MIKAYAAQSPGGVLERFEFERGPLLSNEVDIEVLHCGICHSDLSMLNNDWEITEYPFVGGHEVIGKIKQVGAEVKHLQEGEIVGLGWHAGYCMTCDCCMQGHHNLCHESESTVVGRYGGFSTEVRAKAHSVIALPKELPPEVAGPLFCGGITVFTPLLQYDIKPTSRVGVIGIGGLGHLALQFLKAWGCEVTAFTSNEAKKQEALALGAHHTVDSRHGEIQQKYDLIISTVNIKLDWDRYVSALAPNGRLHFVGATLDPLDIHVSPMIAGQRSMSASLVGSPAGISTMLEFAARHQIKPVVEHFQFDQINEALAHLRDGKAKYRIVLSH